MTVLSTAAIASTAETTVHLVVSSRVTIDRTAAQAWPHLLNLPAWKSSIGTLEAVAGTPGAQGEIRRVTPAGYLIETMLLEPRRRLVFKLYPPDRALFFGFSDFTLSEAGGRTTLNYNVYVEYRFPGLTDQQRREKTAELTRQTQTKLDAEHLHLKALVEGVRNPF